MEDKIVATNRKAYHDYHISDNLEAGVQLKGCEVKSLREGQASLADSFARVDNGEIFVYNMYIAPYKFGNIANPDPLRPRKLLLHKSQIRKLTGALTQKGLTVIPLKVYFKGGIIKVEISLAHGKKQHDKREAIHKRESDKELRRALKEKSR